jgi:cytochrome c2
LSAFRTIIILATLVVVLTLVLCVFIFVGRQTIAPQPLGCATTNKDVVFIDLDTALQNHKGLKVFQANCKSCHRLDQKLVGPALRYTFQARDSVWFRKMIKDGNALVTSGDTLAIRLFNAYNQTPHTSFSSMSRESLDDLIDYLKKSGEQP